MDKKLIIAVTLPYLYTVRDILFTPIWDELAKRKDVHFFLLSGHAKVRKLISERGCSNITCLDLYSSRSVSEQPSFIIKAIKHFNSRVIRRLRKFDEDYLYYSQRYRFVAINDLAPYEIYKKRSSRERARLQVLSDHRRGLSAGRPFPKSKLIYKVLYGFRHGGFGFARQKDITGLQNLNPDLFVFGRLQSPDSAYRVRILRRLGIPMLGVIPSWDHPTTKGPLPRGMSGYIVASKRMVVELAELHGIKKSKILQIGKVQMDLFKKPRTFRNREEFLQKLGVPTDHRLVTFGTNTTGLKEHEISIAKRLASDFMNNKYGKATLLLRTHPQDVNWKRDFLSLALPPWVICMDANSFGNRTEDDMTHAEEDQVMLANLMKHSDVVIQSRGSLALDAIAFDKPVISLAFDGDLDRPPHDSFLLEYRYEHYEPLVAAQGTWIVGSYEALDRAVRAYLRDPSIHAEGRSAIRDEQIEPLDGKASRRFVDYLVESANKARQGTLPEGDWDYSGLGDITWASRQAVDIQNYVQK